MPASQNVVDCPAGATMEQTTGNRQTTGSVLVEKTPSDWPPFSGGPSHPIQTKSFLHSGRSAPETQTCPQSNKRGACKCADVVVGATTSNGRKWKTKAWILVAGTFTFPWVFVGRQE
ncbi:hypothetical protein EYR41_004207 [Orbilia oligospora]|uniref:Uncharacterized protein n=1 Tax=Orbilia oligospora TaxID=2813651 RepID=A0A7C8P0Y2_ORBOL|nr:hypothetical protein TWF751_003257 [Orbilia oligospora]TGJ72304.1 hypothetical protein EYR41_004207 [Orbilia oligospora]